MKSNCAKCGLENPWYRTYCRNCGSSLVNIRLNDSAVKQGFPAAAD